jgi:hypothetical protein
MTPSNKSIDEKHIRSSRAHWHLVTTFSRYRTSPATGWDKNPEYSIVLSKTYPIGGNIKNDSKDMQGFFSGADWIA